MPQLNNFPYKITWAQDTTNILSFTEDELKSGITYKGAVVSNQLNGAINNLSRAMQFQQCMGGYYDKTIEYYKGNVVCIIHTSDTQPETLEYYRCISDSAISNKAPINGATEIDNNGCIFYTGGVVNTTYWKRIDANASNTINRIEINIDSYNGEEPPLYRLISLPDITYTNNGDDNIQELTAELNIRATNNKNYVSVVKLKFNAMYVKNPNDNSYIKPKDYFGHYAPTIEVIDCKAYDSSGNFRTSFLDAEPSLTELPDLFGFHLVTAYYLNSSNTKVYSLYLYPCANTSKIIIEGKSNFTLYTSTQTTLAGVTLENIHYIRNGGCKNAYDKIGTLVEIDSPSFYGYFAERGLYALPDTSSSNDDIVNRTGEQSLGVTSNISAVASSYLTPTYNLMLMQNSSVATIRNHSGCATKTSNSGDIFATGSVGTIDGDSVVDCSSGVRYISEPFNTNGTAIAASDSTITSYNSYAVSNSLAIFNKSTGYGSGHTPKSTDSSNTGQINLIFSQIAPCSSSNNMLSVVVRRLIQLY